jgi:hypothetical protein
MAGGNGSSRTMPTSVLLLRGGGDDFGGAPDLSETQAKALIDAAGNNEAALVQTLLDYKSSAQVQQQGCQRIIDSLAAVATNKTASESLRGSYRAAGGAKCVLESLREHRSGSAAVVVKVRDARRCCSHVGVQILLEANPPMAVCIGSFALICSHLLSFALICSHLLSFALICSHLYGACVDDAGPCFTPPCRCAKRWRRCCGAPPATDQRATHPGQRNLPRRRCASSARTRVPCSWCLTS